ncbi:MAG: hypothetical protein HY704_15240 [Gemmatimonadetes bacterium]|nr:hypothetical protein [Gemmatimonadota bacterium]
MWTIVERHVRSRAPKGRLRASAVLLSLAALGVLAGCESLLEVELPTKVGAEALDDPAIAEILITSVVGDFECAFNNYVPATGMISGELRHSTGARAIFLWSQRRITNIEDVKGCTAFTAAAGVDRGYGVYRPLQTARFQGKDAVRRLDEWGDQKVPSRPVYRATALAHEAYSLALLGESFCDMAIDEGPLLKPPAVLALAEQRFAEAIDGARAASSNDIANMALVGRARVRLDLGKKAEAAADAKLVPKGYVRQVTRSSAIQTRWNLMYQDNINNGAISVDLDYVNLMWGGVADPRVKVVQADRRGADNSIIYWQTKYTSFGSSYRLASWEEAQLIIAEAEGGQSAVNIINQFHSAAALPPFTSSDPKAILDHVIQERSRVLFLEGHRINDMLRHKLPFKTGIGPDGVPYGETTCMPLPRIEIEGNPNIRG